MDSNGADPSYWNVFDMDLNGVDLASASLVFDMDLQVQALLCYAKLLSRCLSCSDQVIKIMYDICTALYIVQYDMIYYVCKR